MLLHAVFLSCIVSSVITNEVYGLNFRTDLVEVNSPARLNLQKRQASIVPPKQGQSDTSQLHVDTRLEAKNPKAEETKVVQQANEGNVEVKTVPSLPFQSSTTKKGEAAPTVSLNTNSTKENAAQNGSATAPGSTTTPATLSKEVNSTAPKAPSYQPDLSNPGVMKRGLIVFGGFALMAIAYFIFYRRKSKNNDPNNAHGTNENNQFRYGVLQSEDRRDNLELSRIPLTMESDEDDDEDLEIFDLEQKKKSLSYVNLQTSDDYVVHEPKENVRDRDNLLLDIEDANSDTLINWSSNGNKSIL